MKITIRIFKIALGLVMAWILAMASWLVLHGLLWTAAWTAALIIGWDAPSFTGAGMRAASAFVWLMTVPVGFAMGIDSRRES
jgi:hypothetical protein